MVCYEMGASEGLVSHSIFRLVDLRMSGSVISRFSVSRCSISCVSSGSASEIGGIDSWGRVVWTSMKRPKFGPG